MAALRTMPICVAVTAVLAAATLVSSGVIPERDNIASASDIPTKTFDNSKPTPVDSGIPLIRCSCNLPECLTTTGEDQICTTRLGCFSEIRSTISPDDGVHIHDPPNPLPKIDVSAAIEVFREVEITTNPENESALRAMYGCLDLMPGINNKTCTEILKSMEGEGAEFPTLQVPINISNGSEEVIRAYHCCETDMCNNLTTVGLTAPGALALATLFQQTKDPQITNNKGIDAIFVSKNDFIQPSFQTSDLDEKIVIIETVQNTSESKFKVDMPNADIINIPANLADNDSNKDATKFSVVYNSSTGEIDASPLLLENVIVDFMSNASAIKGSNNNDVTIYTSDDSVVVVDGLPNFNGNRQNITNSTVSSNSGIQIIYDDSTVAADNSAVIPGLNVTLVIDDEQMMGDQAASETVVSENIVTSIENVSSVTDTNQIMTEKPTNITIVNDNMETSTSSETIEAKIVSIQIVNKTRNNNTATWTIKTVGDNQMMCDQTTNTTADSNNIETSTLNGTVSDNKMMGDQVTNTTVVSNNNETSTLNGTVGDNQMIGDQVTNTTVVSNNNETSTLNGTVGDNQMMGDQATNTTVVSNNVETLTLNETVGDNQMVGDQATNTTVVSNNIETSMVNETFDNQIMPVQIENLSDVVNVTTSIKNVTEANQILVDQLTNTTVSVNNETSTLNETIDYNIMSAQIANVTGNKDNSTASTMNVIDEKQMMGNLVENVTYVGNNTETLTLNGTVDEKTMSVQATNVTDVLTEDSTKLSVTQIYSAVESTSIKNIQINSPNPTTTSEPESVTTMKNQDEEEIIAENKFHVIKKRQENLTMSSSSGEHAINVPVTTTESQKTNIEIKYEFYGANDAVHKDGVTELALTIGGMIVVGILLIILTLTAKAAWKAYRKANSPVNYKGVCSNPGQRCACKGEFNRLPCQARRGLQTSSSKKYSHTALEIPPAVPVFNYNNNNGATYTDAVGDTTYVHTQIPVPPTTPLVDRRM